MRSRKRAHAGAKGLFMPKSLVGSSEYSIAAVSKLTGIGCHALRIWERRYGFPVPHRTPSGHRRYAAEQVQILDHVARRLREGSPLAEVMSEIRSCAIPAREDSTEREPLAVPFDAVLQALLSGDELAAEVAYHEAIDGRSCLDQLRLVIQPALVEVGERWFRGKCDIYQEHFSTEFLRRKLAVLIESARSKNPRPNRTALVATVQGDRHEGGILMLCTILELAGWRALSLGVDLPTGEIQKAVDSWKPDAVCLSFVLSRNVNKRFTELSRINGAPIYVGGRSILNYQGLARRHGLHPIPGPGDVGIHRMIAEIEGGEARTAIEPS